MSTIGNLVGEDSTSWKVIPETSSSPGYKVFDGNIEKPDLDTCEYRIVELDNGLRAVLIHDSDADKSAACLSVHVGHLRDPVDVPGLAHFCEHMLLQGSKPFPAANDFLSFVISNGGARNASTDAAITKYWFSITPSHLKEGIPRLAAFFHSPLFTSSVTAREIYAVDSENKRNLQDDDRRKFQLKKGLSAPGHAWLKFGTGNYASLTAAARKKVEEVKVLNEDDEKADDGGEVGRETRRRLIEWMEQEYCAGRMTLAIIGKEKLDELTDICVREFSPIPNRHLEPRPRVDDYPWTQDQQSCTVFVETVNDYYSFEICIPIPDQILHFRTRPARYLAHFLGHEGPGSVCAYLRKKGWIFDLSAGPCTWNRGIELFSISGKLTSAGYRNYQEVILTIFNYISILKSTFPLASYHFDEMKQISNITFRNREKIQPHTYAIDVAKKLAEPYPPQWLLNAQLLYREWDEKPIQDVLDCLTPERARVMIMAKTHDEPAISEDIKWETEKWYGTRYFIKKFEASFVARAKEPCTNIGLSIPQPNPFIPTNLNVVKREVAQPAECPRCLHRSNLSILWHKRDDQFWVPKGHVYIRLRTLLAYATPRHAVLTSLFIDLLEDDLRETIYDASIAGLSPSLVAHSEGIDIHVSGYNDKLQILLDTVLCRLKNFIFLQDRLDAFIEDDIRAYNNFELTKPVKQSNYYSDYLLIALRWTAKDKVTMMNSPITLDEMQNHKVALLSRLHIETLVTGNLLEEDALAMLKLVENRLACKELLPAEMSLPRNLILPEGANFVYQRGVQNAKELNSSTMVYLDFGDVSDQIMRTKLDLLAHLIKEPTFSELRTKQQLGYIVWAFSWKSRCTMGLKIAIQSQKDPTFLDERIEDFLVMFGSLLEQMSEDDFTSKKEGLVSKKLEKAKNLAEETARFWTRIRSGRYDFSQDKSDANIIQTLTKQDVLDAFNTHLLPQSPKRKKLSVHLLSQSLEQILPCPAHVVKVLDCDDFKTSLQCSAAVRVSSSAIVPAIQE